ncbi:MAG: large-conductance mechanosensitive channel protein MscL [Brumimicrobium sp.]|nr:large-conductance mechanosensitive channel protein MscL [Brumimicrobium sp.]
MLQEFKKFISKGNVMELAVGLIMATYFGAIVKSLVNDIIMPPVGKMLGGVDFSEMKYIIQEKIPESAEGAGDAVAEISVNYGVFINTIITFFIVAFVIFLVIRSYNKLIEKMKKKKEEQEKEPEAPGLSKQEELLTEIRDLLNKEKS